MMNIQTQARTSPTRISRISSFNHREVAEIPNLLMNGEELLGMISGYYTAGTAILCVTSRRLLLIDKKWMRLNFEDIRFESISEVNYSHQIFFASLHFFYTGRDLHFRTWHKQDLRNFAQIVQSKMFEARDSRRTNLLDTPAEPAALTVLQNTRNLERYIQRNKGWQRAERFMATINFSKFGKQIINLESTRH